MQPVPISYWFVIVQIKDNTDNNKMSGRTNIKIDISAMNKFNNTFKEYVKWSKKQPAEIINTKMFYVGRNAVNMTKTADKGKIRNELMADAKQYPGVPLEAILINRDLGRKCKKGLFGEKMAKAVEKGLNKAVSRTNFLRAGWLPGIKKLDFMLKRGDITFIKRYAPKQITGVKQYGQDKGFATPAKEMTTKCWGEIYNCVGQGKQASKTVQKILQEGLNLALIAEMKSMQAYITKKFDAKHQTTFQKKF
jgi:hypothetical protein